MNVVRSRIARKTEAQAEHEWVARTPTVTESVSIESAGTPSAFVPVVSTAASSLTLPPTPSAPVPPMALSLHVRLSNGVECDLGKASIDELTTVINVPGRPLSSGSTKIRRCTRHIFEILTIAAT
jgi:hypothetical protein